MKVDAFFCSHLKYTDAVVFLSSDPNRLKIMLQALKKAAENSDLKVTLSKIKVMNEVNIQITLHNRNI